MVCILCRVRRYGEGGDSAGGAGAGLARSIRCAYRQRCIHPPTPRSLPHATLLSPPLLPVIHAKTPAGASPESHLAAPPSQH